MNQALPDGLRRGGHQRGGQATPRDDFERARNAEAGLDRHVRTLAVMFGWRRFHGYDSRRSTPGFPDLVLVRGARLIFAELKSAGGRLTPDQSVWLSELASVPGIETYVWRPSDLEAIGAILSDTPRARTVPTKGRT